MRVVALLLLALFAFVAHPAAAASSPGMSSLEQQLSYLVAGKQVEQFRRGGRWHDAPRQQSAGTGRAGRYPATSSVTQPRYGSLPESGSITISGKSYG